MLFALLYNGQDELIAAAPAVFQYATGDTYWRDSYAGTIAYDRECQTAHIEVTDDDLIDKLNSLELTDEHLPECRRRIHDLNSPKTKPGQRPKAA